MALVDMFLKLDGVEGESKDASGKGSQIQIDGFSLAGTSPRDSFTNQASGHVRMGHLTIRAKIDKSTPKLFEKLARNAKIPTATLSCRKAGKEQFEYFKITLSEVIVVRVHAGTLDGGANVVPPCEFDLAYGKIEVMSSEQTERGPTSGPVIFSYTLTTNT
jgi:type VI secretion system secreted protein Hcp